MRQLIVCLFVSAIFHPAFVTADQADIAPKVFMYVTDGSRDLDLMLTQEVGVMQKMLEDAGYSVDIATRSGDAMASDATTLVPTVNLSEVEIQNYAGVILPCMAPAPGTEEVPPVVEKLVQQAIKMGKPVAAARGSVTTLAAAGGLVNRDYAFASAVDIAERPAFAGGTFLGTGVVRDDKVSTSGICPLAAKLLDEPDGTVELTREFIASLAEAD